MSVIILFREDYEREYEASIARKYFRVTPYRSCIGYGDLVIGRYSTLPFHSELEQDVLNMNGRLINTTVQHKWIANFEYYNLLKKYTPETWDDNSFYMAPEGEYIVKGKTNSRKMLWNKCMFAKDKRAALDIACELMNDPLIGPQGILYRKYIPLETFETGLNGLPFTNEWRFFFYKGKEVAHGYYWSIAEHANEYIIGDSGIKFANKIANIVKDYVNFFVVDIARTVDGQWILIELNDGTMSGLSTIDPNSFYDNLNLIVGQTE